MFWLALASVSGQEAVPNDGCAALITAPAQFHQCALKTAGSYSPPRTAEGQPDFQGFWGRTMNSYDLEDHPASFMIRAQKSMIVDPVDGRIPYQPWAAAQKRKNAATYVDPLAMCYMTGVPRTTGYMVQRMLVHQSRDHIVFLSESRGYRIMPIDGRPHVGGGIRLWNGDARGRWEGNTLVIDVTNQNGMTWFDIAGNFASETLHVVERLTLVDNDTMHYQATMTDPKVFTRPWTIATALRRSDREDSELWLEECHETERSSDHQLRTHQRYPGFAAATGR